MGAFHETNLQIYRHRRRGAVLRPGAAAGVVPQRAHRRDPDPPGILARPFRTLNELVQAHHAQGAAVTALTARLSNPTGYGRIVRDSDGQFAAIVEQADASPEQRAINEINSGMYAFDGDRLADAVKRVPTDNAKGEED